jgi:hypothetical protein
MVAMKSNLSIVWLNDAYWESSSEDLFTFGSPSHYRDEVVAPPLSKEWSKTRSNRILHSLIMLMLCFQTMEMLSSQQPELRRWKLVRAGESESSEFMCGITVGLVKRGCADQFLNGSSHCMAIDTQFEV